MAVSVVCPQCSEHGRGRVVMVCRAEYPGTWAFECPRCGTLRAVDKQKIGGTIGAGDRRSDGSRSAYGKGYGHGRSRYNPIT